MKWIPGVAWQVWGGSFHMDRWSENGKKTRPAKESWLAGASTSGSLSTLSWAATGYGYDNQAVGETRLTLPLGGAINVNLQNMLASDSSWSSIGSISATLPGGFSSLWVNQEKTRIGNQLRRSDADNRAIITRQITIKMSTAVPLVRLACGPVFSAITTATATPIQGNISLSISRYHWATGLAQG